MEQKQLCFTFTECTLDELSREDRGLVEQAIAATNNSYSPYSSFAVGAAVMLQSGVVVPGCNQENAAFPVCMCAERTALFSCGAQHSGELIKSIAITARGSEGELVSEPISPCGSCRQAIREFEVRQGQPIRIILYAQNRTYIFSSVADLLPFSFDEIDN